jgi:hypothetical protein
VTQTDTRSVRELALEASAAQDATIEEAQASQRARATRETAKHAATYLHSLFPDQARNAEIVATGENEAQIRLDGERFLFRYNDHADWSFRRLMYHVTACPACGDDRTAEFSDVAELGTLLRLDEEGKASVYWCWECERRREEAREAAAAEPAKDAPRMPTRDEALREAAGYAALAAEVHGSHLEMFAYASLSQAWSALAAGLGRENYR